LELVVLKLWIGGRQCINFSLDVLDQVRPVLISDVSLDVLVFGAVGDSLRGVARLLKVLLFVLEHVWQSCCVAVFAILFRLRFGCLWFVMDCLLSLGLVGRMG
jgi:hypothetical protein